LDQSLGRFFRKTADNQGLAQVANDFPRRPLELRFDLLRLEHWIALQGPFDEHIEKHEHLRGKIEAPTVQHGGLRSPMQDETHGARRNARAVEDQTISALRACSDHVRESPDLDTGLAQTQHQCRVRFMDNDRYQPRCRRGLHREDRARRLQSVDVTAEHEGPIGRRVPEHPDVVHDSRDGPGETAARSDLCGEAPGVDAETLEIAFF